MSLLNWFNKPKWQSPNENVRMMAIQTSEDNELLNSLTEIIKTDVSVKVKKAALARVIDPNELLDILQSHPLKEIKNQARKKLIHWFSAQDDEQHIVIVKKLKDAECIRALADQATNKTIREHALKQIKQQGLLSELLFKEPEAELQQLILDKIEQPKKLQTLLKKAKKESNLFHLINSKLNENHANDPNNLAIELCLQLENVVHGKAHGVELAVINSSWKNIENDVTEATKLRFKGAFEAAKMILDPEHRAQFLKQQKLQRAAAQLHELEQLVAKPTAMTLKQVQASVTKYQGLSESDFIAAEYVRYQQAIDGLIAKRDAIQKEQHIPETATALLDELNQQLAQHIVQPELLTQFKKRWHQALKKVQPSEALNIIKQQFDEGCLKLAEKIEQSAKLRTAAAEKAVALIEPTITQIKEGHLVKAKEMSNQIADFKKTAGFNHPAIKQKKYQLDSVWQQLKDLRKWQKWSNDKARQDIIDELHAMIGKGLHPDAVLKKLKEANERWYALEDMEKLPGDKFPARNQKMWQDFRIVSKALFEPTQPFFEKRNEQQDGFLGEIESHIKIMQGIDVNEATERDLARLSRDAIKFLKSLDKLPPKKRGVTAKKLRKSIDRIDSKLNEFYDDAAHKKLKLIEQAKALMDLEDQQEAIEAAKTLQHQWKTAGIVKQHTERKLWKKFRQANDAIFKRREQENKAKQAEQQQHRLQAQNLINEFKGQIKKGAGIEQLNQLKTTFNKQWFELEKPESLLQHEYQHVLQMIDDQINKLKSSAILKEHKIKQKLDLLFTEHESGKIDAAERDEQSNKLMTPEIKAFFAPRFEPDGNFQNLPDLLIQAEFITGLETPAEFMEDRMAYQVKVLAMRMSGENTSSDQEQVSQWLTQWYLTPKPDAAYLKSQTKRIKQAIKTMMAQLT